MEPTRSLSVRSCVNTAQRPHRAYARGTYRVVRVQPTRADPHGAHIVWNPHADPTGRLMCMPPHRERAHGFPRELGSLSRTRGIEVARALVAAATNRPVRLAVESLLLRSLLAHDSIPRPKHTTTATEAATGTARAHTAHSRAPSPTGIHTAATTTAASGAVSPLRVRPGRHRPLSRGGKRHAHIASN